MSEEIDFDNEEDEALAEHVSEKFTEAVLYSSDWTVETILSQLRRQNIQLNPNFQRRDAWSNSRKGKFIESLIVGLPVPQLVLAETKGQRGRYIVLDGKQRLLSILKFTESSENGALGFALSGLEIRKDLFRKKFYNLENDTEFFDDLNSFNNYTIRTVIIRNWPNNDFLHQVFLRLNTGSVKLSPQELRQAMAPGKFTSFADDYSAESKYLQALLGRSSPDPRMRDVELLVRHIAFREHLSSYEGRMKSFLDDVCSLENGEWDTRGPHIRDCAEKLEAAISALMEILQERLARKPGSRSFNRAIFDALAFFTAQDDVRVSMLANRQKVSDAYDRVLKDDTFLSAIESDTAGIPNTIARLRKWGETLSDALGMTIKLPTEKDKRIQY